MKTRLLIALLVTSFAFTGLSCKRTKKASEDSKAKAEREARLAREREEKMKREEEERRRKEEEEKKKAEKESYGKLESYFNRIASDPANAGATISEALALFSSPDTPVLIVIHQSGEQKDYDRPTTIKKYLEYLKDQKKSPNAINKLVYDNGGKIKEVELIKK
jgi:single-stranded DNA-specific DHH superfamily exonuclease